MKTQTTTIQFPTTAHRDIFWAAVDRLKRLHEIVVINISGSVARGQGSFDADVDLDVFAQNDRFTPRLASVIKRIEQELNAQYRKRSGVGRFFELGIHERLLRPKPQPRHWTSGPDDFEIVVGHSFVNCNNVFSRGGAYERARHRFVPYYAESLRKKRLREVTKFCLNNIAHIEPFVRRKLYFQAYRRFYDASREFLQALFISRRVYPLDYDKWVKYELTELLGLPAVARELSRLYTLKKLESRELVAKGRRLKQMLRKYVRMEGSGG